MSRSLRQRIERLEGDQGRPGIPHIIVATCPIPGDGKAPTMKTVERWLADGLAHIAFRGHAVLYNGGRTRPLAIEEWQAQHCTGDADKSVH
jgi:hypothetical protein